MIRYFAVEQIVEQVIRAGCNVPDDISDPEDIADYISSHPEDWTEQTVDESYIRDVLHDTLELDDPVGS
jgi:hypothetical protein